MVKVGEESYTIKADMVTIKRYQKKVYGKHPSVFTSVAYR